MRCSDQARRQFVAESSQPTPRSIGGRRVNLTVSLYKAGHGAITSPQSLPLLGNNDRELVEQFAEMLRLMRREMENGK